MKKKSRNVAKVYKEGQNQKKPKGVRKHAKGGALFFLLQGLKKVSGDS
jgi:hypothetical protein